MSEEMLFSQFTPYTGKIYSYFVKLFPHNLGILYEVLKISVIQSDIRATAENRLRSTGVPALPASLGLAILENC